MTDWLPVSSDLHPDLIALVLGNLIDYGLAKQNSHDYLQLVFPYWKLNLKPNGLFSCPDADPCMQKLPQSMLGCPYRYPATVLCSVDAEVPSYGTMLCEC